MDAIGEDEDGDEDPATPWCSEVTPVPSWSGTLGTVGILES